MSNSLFKGKSTRTKIFTAITIAAIVLLIALNTFLTYFGDQGQIFIDMTPEGFYSMTDKMIDSCEEILESEIVSEKEIEIIFCADPDVLERDYRLRPTYFMALQLRNKFDNVSVEEVNIDYDPSINTVYRTTSHREIVYTDMIVTYDGRYKVVDATSFWTEDSFSYNGEYRMVSLLASLTAQNSPAAYFVTNHGELYYTPDPKTDAEIAMNELMASAAELIEERGLQIKTIDLGADNVSAIPEDCALLIINAPKSDFVPDESRFNEFSYVSELEMIDRYLRAKSGSLMVNKGYDISLPNLESYLKEWGIGFGDAQVRDEGNSLTPDNSTIVGVYDIDSFGGAYYGDFAELSTSPKMIFTDTGYIYNTFAPADYKAEAGGHNTHTYFSEFIYTSDAAIGYADKDGNVVKSAAGKKALAAAAVRTVLDSDTAESTYSYVFCTNSESFLSNELIGNKSYANNSIMASLISSISRIDRYASMSLGGLSQNSPSYGGKQTQSTTLSDEVVEVYSPDAKQIIAVNRAFLPGHQAVITVVVCVFPVTLIALGIIVCLKRKYL